MTGRLDGGDFALMVALAVAQTEKNRRKKLTTDQKGNYVSTGKARPTIITTLFLIIIILANMI